MARDKRELPKTDKGWQAWLSNVRPPAEREWQSGHLPGAERNEDISGTHSQEG